MPRIKEAGSKKVQHGEGQASYISLSRENRMAMDVQTFISYGYRKEEIVQVYPVDACAVHPLIQTESFTTKRICRLVTFAKDAEEK